MKCVTYGTTVFVMIVLIFILSMILKYTVDSEVGNMTGDGFTRMGNVAMGVFGLIILTSFGLFIWWIIGFFSDCSDGYLLAPSLGKCTKEKKITTDKSV